MPLGRLEHAAVEKWQLRDRPGAPPGSNTAQRRAQSLDHIGVGREGVPLDLLAPCHQTGGGSCFMQQCHRFEGRRSSADDRDIATGKLPQIVQRGAVQAHSVGQTLELVGNVAKAHMAGRKDHPPGFGDRAVVELERKGAVCAGHPAHLDAAHLAHGVSAKPVPVVEKALHRYRVIHRPIGEPLSARYFP